MLRWQSLSLQPFVHHLLQYFNSVFSFRSVKASAGCRYWSSSSWPTPHPSLNHSPLTPTCMVSSLAVECLQCLITWEALVWDLLEWVLWIQCTQPPWVMALHVSDWPGSAQHILTFSYFQLAARSRGGREQPSPGSSWTCWRTCSLRPATPTSSWGRRWLSRSTSPSREFRWD